MTQYRILRKNSRFGWRYIIQYKLFNLLWITSINQQFNEFNKWDAAAKICLMKQNEIDFIERKKRGNSVVQ